MPEEILKRKIGEDQPLNSFDTENATAALPARSGAVTRSAANNTARPKGVPARVTRDESCLLAALPS